MKLARTTLFLVAALACCPLTASAQAGYPAKPLRLVVPFPAGGPTDVFARQYATRLSSAIGQPVVVENRTGASGAIGTLEVKRAAPDGYTLLFGTASTHALYGLLATKPQYDILLDFTHIAVLGGAPVVFATHPSLPPNLKGVLDLARAYPGKLQYGSPGEGTFLHLAAERLKHEAGGLNIPHIPYRGSAQSLPALIGGEVGMSVDTLGSALPMYRAGKLKLVAQATRKRSALAPEVPTVDEAIRIKGFEATLWNVVSAPAKTPPEAIDVLAAATTRVMRDTTLHEQLAKLAIEPVSGSTPATATEFVRQEIARWKPVVDATGIKLD